MFVCFLGSAMAASVPGPSLHVGDPALLFSLPAINEDAALHAVARPTVALSDFTGVSPGFPSGALVVHFMRREGGESQLQALARLDKKYASKDATFLAVLVGGTDVASTSSWVQGQRVEFPVLDDAHGIVASRYGVRAYPMTFVVGAEGDVLAIGQAASSSLEADLDVVVSPLVGK